MAALLACCARKYVAKQYKQRTHDQKREASLLNDDRVAAASAVSWRPAGVPGSTRTDHLKACSTHAFLPLVLGSSSQTWKNFPVSRSAEFWLGSTTLTRSTASGRTKRLYGTIRRACASAREWWVFMNFGRLHSIGNPRKGRSMGEPEVPRHRSGRGVIHLVPYPRTLGAFDLTPTMKTMPFEVMEHPSLL